VEKEKANTRERERVCVCVCSDRLIMKLHQQRRVREREGARDWEEPERSDSKKRELRQ
jgi:hypothetical protein